MIDFNLNSFKKEFSSIDKLVFILITLLSVFIPFWNLGTSIITIILLLVFLYRLYKGEATYISTLEIRFFFTLFFIYKVLLSLLNGSFINDFNYLKTLLPFLILAFVFPSINKRQIKFIKLFFVVIFCSFQVIICFKVLFFLSDSNNFTLLNGASINDRLQMERPYLGFFSLLSLIMLLSLNEKSVLIKRLSIVYLLFTTFFLSLISARMSIISLIVLIFWFYLFYTKVNKKIKIISLLPIIGFIMYLSFNSSILGERFSQIKKDPRLIIWNSGLELLEDNNKILVFGLKSDKLLENSLLKKYSDIKDKEMRAWYLKSKFNTHNQYLHELLSYGIVSLLILILILRKFILLNGVSSYGFMLIILLMLFLSVENVFQRQMGVTAFVFYNLFFLKKNDE